jgi:hypothetical protein
MKIAREIKSAAPLGKRKPDEGGTKSTQAGAPVKRIGRSCGSSQGLMAPFVGPPR